VRFSIADRGIGISAGNLETIFDRFIQVDSSATRRQGGAGLGLAISRRLVELMGGRMWVASELGRGSTFYFTAQMEVGDPAGEPNARSAGMAPARAVAGPERPVRVLLVDDAPESARVIAAYLRGISHQLDAAENGEQAVARFPSGAYDIVLMDMQMPVMDGETATRAIRAWERAQGRAPVAIIALTAHSFDAAQRRSVEAGCTAHASKPLKKKVLIDLIRRYAKVEISPASAPPPRVIEVEPELLALLPGFIAKRKGDARAIRSALADGNLALIGVLAHNMKGTGASYGLPTVSELGRSLGDAVEHLDVAAIGRVVDELADYLGEVEVGCSAPERRARSARRWTEVAEERPELIDVEGFAEERGGAQLDGAVAGLFVIERRDEDHGGHHSPIAQRREDVEPARARHGDIAHQDVGGSALESIDHSPPVGADDHGIAIAAQALGDQEAHVLVVVGQENRAARLRDHRRVRGRRAPRVRHGAFAHGCLLALASGGFRSQRSARSAAALPRRTWIALPPVDVATPSIHSASMKSARVHHIIVRCW
jgi:CheY-like chemotaxis protein